MRRIDNLSRRIIDTVSTTNRRSSNLYPSICPTSHSLRFAQSVDLSSSAMENFQQDVQQDIQQDNPCWGSPTNCDLKHLMSQFPKETSIVYESTHYVVLNKPPDLRMDGPYAATVHKLLTFWYPPPSLLKVSQRGSDDDAVLLEVISKLHQHNSISDNALRPCHQLDYATSGLLCVARTHAAAAHAIRQWEERRVTKEYLALVQGSRIGILEESSLPRFSPSYIRATLQRLEDSYKRSRRPKSKETFQGFQPAHAIFQKFKATILQNNGRKNKKRRGPPEMLLPEQWHNIWETVLAVIRGDEADKSVDSNSEGLKENPTDGISTETLQLLQKLDWKQLCQTNLKWKSAFERATERHNDLLRQALQKQDGDKMTANNGDFLTTFPTIFGETIEDASQTINGSVVYIFCPLAQGTDPHDFFMKLPPDPELLEKYPHMKPFVGPLNLDYKPSLTKCTIVSSAGDHHYGTAGNYDNNEPQSSTITKVQLLPLTGRRHQLRVHMALLMGDGYGILGDATYNRHTTLVSAIRPGPPHRNDTPPEAFGIAAHRRMCLHSHKLSLRLLVNDQSNESPSDELIHLEALDPF